MTASLRSTDPAAYERTRLRQIAYGRWQPYVDATPTREHVQRLQTKGLGWKRIAELAGVHKSVVEKLLYGAPCRGMGPSKRIRPGTAEKLLAVSVDADVRDGVQVDATGTHRRLQALIALGWSQNKLAVKLGMSASNFGAMLSRPQVRESTRRAVLAMYQQLWHTNPPENEHRDKIAASRARATAARRGWLPPMAWDDDLIDDPKVGPDLDEDEGQALDEVAIARVVAGDQLDLNPAERIEVARRMTAAGDSRTQIAARLRCSDYHVIKLLEAS